MSRQENREKHKIEHSEEEKKRAAYALNMCTVSVSQIIDYHDSYILEQEYNAIFNNLNLKEMPKDEALLRIITELLNTITFFRIQEIKKDQIEKKYQQRMKTAIWSAVPSLSVVVSGNPVAIALSIVTQVGSGYMNYRKEKAFLTADKEDLEIELQITAIEQLNALKRELFTTAWRLADEYDFDDKWRLTEKQIKQYNSILMDTDEYRKYSRFESIADNFVAYPPFWYFYGHTANYIAETAKRRAINNKQSNDAEREEYNKDITVARIYSFKAKEHFEEYYKLMDCNILREDQLTASFALEYIDILWEDDNRDDEKIARLIKLAEDMAANSLDILQLCAISYLKIGQTTDAARLLKILVNEEYNTSANAKLLSRIYVSDYLYGNLDQENKAFADYKVLSETIDPIYLFPMPPKRPINVKMDDEELQKKYIEEQKMLLQKEYRLSMNEFIKANIALYNRLWPVPPVRKEVDDSYFDYTLESAETRYNDVEKTLKSEKCDEYIAKLRDASLRIRYLDLLNGVLLSLDELELFRTYESKDELILLIRKKIVLTRKELKEYQEKLENGVFSYDDYMEMQQLISFQAFTEEFFDELKNVIMTQIDDIEANCAKLNKTPMEYLEAVELDLIEFCRKNNLTDPNKALETQNRSIDVSNSGSYFDYSILGDDIDDELGLKAKREEMLEIVKELAPCLTESSADVEILLPGNLAFDSYFNNSKLNGAGLKFETIAILDDKTRKDIDLLLTYNGLVVVNRNSIQRCKDYKGINYKKIGDSDELEIGWPDKYVNKNVDIQILYTIIQKLGDISAGE